MLSGILKIRFAGLNIGCGNLKNSWEKYPTLQGIAKNRIWVT